MKMKSLSCFPPSPTGRLKSLGTIPWVSDTHQGYDNISPLTSCAAVSPAPVEVGKSLHHQQAHVSVQAGVGLCGGYVSLA